MDAPLPTRRPPSRTTLLLISVPLVASVVMAYVGDALAPTLVDQHPLWLVALNARNRNLALTTNLLDTVPYYAVAFTRLVATDPLWYLLGWFYGDAAVRWAERNTRTLGDTLRWAERHFKRFGIPLVFLMPNNWICLFAGASGMRPAVFLAANIPGTILRLYVIRVLGRTFSGPIDSLLDLIAEYRTPLLALSIGLVALTLFSERRRGGGELGGLTQLSDDLDEAPPPGTSSSEPYEPSRQADPD